MTGGLAEWYNPADLKIDDFYLIRAAYQSGAVIGCLSVVSSPGSIPTWLGTVAWEGWG